MTQKLATARYLLIINAHIASSGTPKINSRNQKAISCPMELLRRPQLGQVTFKPLLIWCPQLGHGRSLPLIAPNLQNRDPS
jgi:hypothetical protein